MCLSIWGNRAWLLTQRWVVKCACVCAWHLCRPVSVCVSGTLQCWNRVYWWERWRLLSMSHPIRRHLHVCLRECGSRGKLSAPTTARSLTPRPKSSLRQQEEHKRPPCGSYREQYTEMDALTDTEATGNIFPRRLIKIGCFHLLSEKTGFFLYNLIDSSSEEEVQAQAETLKTYFTQLKTQVHNDQGDTNNWKMEHI